MPVGLNAAKVDMGRGLFTKNVFFNQGGLGLATDIRFGAFEGRKEGEILVVCQHGAAFPNLRGSTRKTIHFAEVGGTRRVVAVVDKDGALNFLSRGYGRGPVGLFGPDGNLRWEYENWEGVDDAAAGDVNGEGRTEFAVGLNGFGGLHLLDSQGKTIWSEHLDRNVWHVEILDPTGDGHGLIYHSEAGGELKVRDASGRLVGRYRPTSYVGDFAPTRWGNDARPLHLLLPDKERLVVIDLQGYTAGSLEAPDCGLLGDVEGTPVHLAAGEVYYAALVAYPNWKRSILFVYDGMSNLSYREVFEEPCTAVAAIPDRDSEKLLVGCEREVWSYSLRADRLSH
jgi:hypothetical protein